MERQGRCGGGGGGGGATRLNQARDNEQPSGAAQRNPA